MGAALFLLGRVVATPGALEVLAATRTDALALLLRHVSGDWGGPARGRPRERAQPLSTPVSSSPRCSTTYSRRFLFRGKVSLEDDGY